MPEITVQALVTGPEGVLLVREQGQAEWRLPGGPLAETDETVEEGIHREVESWLGIDLMDEPEFLDTLYERLGAETVVHNLFLLPHTPELRTADGVEHQWIAVDDLDDLPLAGWLREGLRVAFGGEPEPEFDLSAIQAAVAPVVSAAPVIIVTGPAGAGKSTVGRELCRRFPRAAHISVDFLRDLVVSGYASPIPGESDPEESDVQNQLATVNAAALARNFSLAGMVAVIDEVLETPDGLDRYLEALGPDMDVRVITLLPNAEELARRDTERPAGDRMGARSEELRRIIAGNGETRGLRLDSSSWDVEQTVDIILERLGEARVIAVWEEDL
ncbi:MAG: AAA family ATPase [Dehalococcoidia bacterium]